MIHLHAGPVINTLPPIVDPDPLLSCDLMDGRDAFLTLARDKHWEFSSLRRSKWSTLCMLVELHTQGQDRFVYTCNECKHHVETRWHCTVCEVGPTTSFPSPAASMGFRLSTHRCHCWYLYTTVFLLTLPGFRAGREAEGFAVFFPMFHWLLLLCLAQLRHPQGSLWFWLGRCGVGTWSTLVLW